jgi:hypothetical protein
MRLSHRQWAIAFALFLDMHSHKKGVWGYEGGAMPHLHTPIFPSRWEHADKMRSPCTANSLTGAALARKIWPISQF